MELQRLEVQRFRNLADQTHGFHPRFNIFEGPNGQGKTNLLEAIYLLGTLRSFRESKTKGLIAWEARDALVRGEVQRGGVTRALAVELAQRGRKAMKDGKLVRRLYDYFGHLHVVVFSPEDLSLTKGSPSERRRFLDRAIFQVVPAYFEEMRAFQTALKSRNKLLKQAFVAGGDVALFESFDMTLCQCAAKVLWRRLQFIERFQQVFAATFQEITDSNHTIELRYDGPLTALLPETELITLYSGLIDDSRRADFNRGFTTRGPHVDDLKIILDGHVARAHASQGQHRALSLALKIAELRMAEEALGTPPLLLLDDVSSELDERRNAQLMHHLDTHVGQVFITTTDKKWIHLGSEARVFSVSSGEVSVQG